MKSTLYTLLILSQSYLFTSCLIPSSRQARTKYYRNSIRPYKITPNLDKGDSVLVQLGDTIPFKLSSSKIGHEKGKIFIKRNQYNKIEFYEIGEWTDNRPSGLIQKGLFTQENGLIMHKQWKEYAGKKYMISDNYRFVRNDSLIEVQNWYNGYDALQLQEIYYVNRGHNLKYRDREKKIKIGTSKVYSIDGKLKKSKVHTDFKLTEE